MTFWRVGGDIEREVCGLSLDVEAGSFREARRRGNAARSMERERGEWRIIRVGRVLPGNRNIEYSWQAVRLLEAGVAL